MRDGAGFLRPIAHFYFLMHVKSDCRYLPEPLQFRALAGANPIQARGPVEGFERSRRVKSHS